MITLYDVLIDVRNKLLKALEEKNRSIGEQVFSTLATLRDIAYEHKEQQQAIIIEDLLDSARSIAGGVFFKAEIPSVQEIQTAFLPAKEAS
jgi:hypothetical protein